MKRTVFGIIAIVMLLIVILSTTVNAATLTTNKNQMEKGDIVTVTITTKEAVESIQFDLKFDTTKYQFVNESVQTNLSIVDSNVIGDTLIVSAFDTSKTASTLTVQFKAIENGEAIPFTISNTEFSKDGVEVADTIAIPTVKVTVAEPVEEPSETPETPEIPEIPEIPVTPETDNKNEQPAEANNDKQEENTKNNEKVDEENKKSTGTYVDENGKTITKLPQTGSYIPSVISAIVLLGIASVVGYKMIKNK